MAPLLTIDADASEVLAAMDRLGDQVSSHVKAAAKVTADAIAKETRARIPRRAGGPTYARHTADGVTVEETYSGDGYVVFIAQPDMAGLPGWLEFGTKHMTPRPALFASANLERGSHDRRIVEAVNDAIEGVGLGD